MAAARAIALCHTLVYFSASSDHSRPSGGCGRRLRAPLGRRVRRASGCPARVRAVNIGSSVVNTGSRVGREQPEKGTTRARHLLVVEDDAEIRQVLGDILALTGYMVRVAANGAAGLALLAEERPDAILLDMVMPGMNGPAFLAALAARGVSPPPVILLS